MTLSVDSALQLIAQRCGRVAGAERVALRDAEARVLADDVSASIDVPPTRNSAVDGYGLRHADLPRARSAGLSLVGVAAAGHAFERPVGPGECVRIFTGAVPPGGVDAIAMQEEVLRAGDRITLTRDIPAGANIRAAGEDIARNSIVAAAGQTLGPFEIGLLASIGIADIPVRNRVRVGVFSAGAELIETGRTPGAGRIFDANRPILIAMLRRMGCDPRDLGILPDSRTAIAAALGEAAGDCDAIVTSAGVSVGDEDHMRAAIDGLGGLDFSGVAIKPGKPVAFGHVRGTPIFALPGNPVAMIVTFLMLARPGLMGLAGARVRPPLHFPVEIGFSLDRRPGPAEYLRCALTPGPDGPVALRHPRGGSGILSSMSQSDGLVALPEGLATVTPGMRLPFIPFCAFGL